MSMSTRVRRALGAAALITGAAVVATAGTTAAAPPAALAGETAAQAAAPHGDPVSAARSWSAAGEPFSVQVPVALEKVPACTVFQAQDDTAHEVALTGPRWHLVIAVPSDVAANVTYVNGGRDLLYAQAVQSVKSIEAFYRQRVGTGDTGQAAHGWTMRFDHGTSCGPQFPDISVYHLPRTQAQYTQEPFFGVVADLDASGLYERANSRYLVHYAGKSVYCGQSYIYSPADASGGAKYSITYNLHTLALTGASVPCDWTTDAHEMGHSIGAATGGPLNNDGAHTWDCNNDVMSYGGPVCGDGALYFDFREDNYFSHSGGWNDTDQSAYWCKPGC